MPVSCCVIKCTNRFKKDSGIIFYEFPKDKHCRLLWKSALKRKAWDPTSYERVCICHFAAGAILYCKFENGFNYNRLVDNIKRDFLQNQTGVKFIASRIDRNIQLTLTDSTGENSVAIGQKIFKDIGDDISGGGYKYIFSAIEIKVSGLARDKKTSTTASSTTSSTSTTPLTTPLTTPSTTSTFTTTKTISTATTEKVIEETTTTAQDHQKATVSSHGRNTKPTGRFSVVDVVGITLGTLVLFILALILLFLYRRGKISRPGRFLANIHNRPVPLDDLHSPTFDNEGGFQNPMYGTQTYSSNKMTADSDTYKYQGFDNPLYDSEMNQGTLYDDPAEVSPPFTMGAMYNPDELQDSTI